MAEDIQDQGMPTALQPRPGWDKAARNPEAIHGSLDVTSTPSTGYMGPSYQPPKVSPRPHSEDAGELDQTSYTAIQQGHRLGRTNNADGAGAGGTGTGTVLAIGLSGGDSGFIYEIPQPTGGRPAWDSRFHLERTAWDMQPRTALLRPPSSNAFPGGGRRYNVATYDGYFNNVPGSGFGDYPAQGPGQRRLSVAAEGPDAEHSTRSGSPGVGSPDAFGGRTTILPGLHATSPSLRPSPYYAAPGAPLSPNRASVMSTAAPAVAGSAPRPSRADLAESYVGRAYSPDDATQSRNTGLTGTSPDAGAGVVGSSGVGAAAENGIGGGGISGGAVQAAAGRQPDGGAEADDEGGMDGRGTHLPALDRAYFGKQCLGMGALLGGGTGGRQAGGKGTSSVRPASMPGAAYLPAKKRPSKPRSARQAMKKAVTTARRPASLTTHSHHGVGHDEAEGGTGGGGGGGGSSDRSHDATGGPLSGGTWRPSGKQPIPDSVPPVPQSTRRTAAPGEKLVTQEEADRRRAAPRDPAIYSPERYPLVGQGWFMPPEKFPPNPAYAGVKAKYMEIRPRRDLDDDKPTHMPDIHFKPWLNPGKHLVTDSSAPPPKLTGTAGARPSYALSPGGTGASVGGTLRSDKGTGGKGRGRKKRDSSTGRSGSGSGSASEADAGGDREVLAVIRGVRLMSIVKRDALADEARLQAEEDEEFAAEDTAAAARQLQQEESQRRKAAAAEQQQQLQGEQQAEEEEERSGAPDARGAGASITSSSRSSSQRAAPPAPASSAGNRDSTMTNDEPAAGADCELIGGVEDEGTAAAAAAVAEPEAAGSSAEDGDGDGDDGGSDAGYKEAAEAAGAAQGVDDGEGEEEEEKGVEEDAADGAGAEEYSEGYEEAGGDGDEGASDGELAAAAAAIGNDEQSDAGGGEEGEEEGEEEEDRINLDKAVDDDDGAD